MKVVEIHNEPYESYGFVFYNCSQKEAAKWIRKKLKGVSKHIPQILEEERDCKGMCIGDKSCGANWVIWLSIPPKKPEGIANLAHEASHAAMKVLKHWSIEAESNGGEEVAMLTGYVVQKVLNGIS